jgi:MOSC domain-containing protein YiiM
MSSIMNGKVVSVQICPGYRKPMRKLDTVDAIAGKGLRNDMHAIEESQRQILLIEEETLDQLQLSIGDVKENITTRNIDLMSLHPGQNLKIGNEAVLEITKPCAPCSRMDEIRPGLQKELAGKRGMLARVVKNGTITASDIITVL